MPNLADYCLVILDATPFHGMMQRHQQLAKRLAATMPVVYVELTPSAAAVFFKRAGKPEDLQGHKQGLREIAPNLYVLRCPPGAPTRFNYTAKMEANMRRNGAFVEQQLQAKGFKKRILMVARPKAIEMTNQIPHDLLVYDCHDSYGDFAEEAKVKEQVKALEARTFKEADLVLVTAKNLYKRAVEANSHTYLVPNGADVAHFQQANPPKPKKDYGVDIDALAAQGKVVGYIGTLAEWFDSMLMISTAQLNPKVSFVFIGPIETNLDSLRALRNTYFTGRVDYQDLPYFISKFDACIIPFVNSPVTDNANLVKLYEYLATGKPIVTTDIPEVRDFEGLVQIGNNGRAFYTKLEMELNISGNTPQKPWVIEKRKEVAAENSWEARVERIQGLLAGALEGRYPEPSPEDTAKIGAGAARFKTPPVAAAAAATAGQAHGDGHHH